MAKNRQIITTYHYPPRTSSSFNSAYTWESTTTTTTTKDTTVVPPTQPTLPFRSTIRSNYTNSYNKSGYDNKYKNSYNNGFNYKTTVSNYNNDYDKSEIFYEKFKNDTSLPVNRSSDLGVYFNGSNFGLLSEHSQIGDSFSLSFQFRTAATNGLIMIMVDSSTNNAFLLSWLIHRACLYIDGEPDSTWTEFPTKILSNQVWIDVNIKITGNTIYMDVKNKNFIKTHRNRFDFPIRGDLFIAGYSASTKVPNGMRSKKFYNGEIRSLKINDYPISWYGTPHNLTARLRNWN